MHTHLPLGLTLLVSLHRSETCRPGFRFLVMTRSQNVRRYSECSAAIHIDPRRGFRILFLWGIGAEGHRLYPVSTDEQATEGISLEVQKDRVIHYCQQFGLNLIDIYQDEWTGKEIARPGLQSALAKMVQSDAMLMSVSPVGSLTQRRRLALPTGYVLRSEMPVQVPRVRCGRVDAKTAAGETLVYFRAVMAQGRSLAD